MMEEIKIVTYNVNGLRPRIAQFGSLLKFLSSLDAHIICLQETKLSRQEFTADLVMADGYESFFSCTKTTGQGRVGYSGVATFCRVKCPFSSNEVALPLAAEEGFTGLLETSRDFGNKYSEKHGTVEGLDGFEKEELLKVDSEGRCVITDHGHFVLFNIYGPCVPSDDAERTQFKLTFFEILQKRWEILLKQGRTVVVVGDLNIAPAAIDRCDAKPDFEKNEFRTWMRSMLVEHGGPFYDIFRAKHPERRDAYTCWSQSTGAEEFNYGSRIDHILISKACLHKKHDTEENHNFVTCHVKDCDIMMQFQRWKPGITPRWKGGRSNKLEGSDHVPVYTTLMELPQVQEHSTPSLSTRYTPMVRGIQQTLASVLLKRQENGKAIFNEASIDVSNENSMKPSCSEKVKRTIQSSSNTETKDIMNEAETKKKPRQNQWSQLSLKSFFQKTSDVNICDETQIELNVTNSTHDQENQNESGSQKEKNNHALLEWQRIQDRMRNSIPLCKGHGEKCVARVVKKPGPNCGRRFYVCCRPEGPASNPETNCGYFKWVAPKSRIEGMRRVIGVHA